MLALPPGPALHRGFKYAGELLVDQIDATEEMTKLIRFAGFNRASVSSARFRLSSTGNSFAAISATTRSYVSARSRSTRLR